MFYANEHEPVHVHGKSQGREARAEIIVINGIVSEIRYDSVLGRAPLESNKMRFFSGTGNRTLERDRSQMD